MIKSYLTFCSVIYHFYVRKKDNIPVFYVFLASSTVLTANILGIYDIVRYFVLPNLPFSKTFAFIILASTCLLNYLTFIHSGKYKQIYPSKQQGFYSVLYIVLSFGLVIWTANIHRARNLEAKQQQIEQQK